MKILLIIFATFLCSNGVRAIDDPPLANRTRPISFVSDPSNWLPREKRESLESFLRAKSNNRDVEVFVLLEPLPIRPLEKAKTLLQEQGNRWTNKNWTIISYQPGQIGVPTIVSGGPIHSEINSNTWDNEILWLLDLSLQSWSGEPDVDFLARKISDSTAFYSGFKDATIQRLVKKRNEEYSEEKRILKLREIYFTIIAIASLLTLIAGIFLVRRLYHARRKMRFPPTSWSSRLGAPHSGGSSVIHRFQPPKA